MNMALVIKLLLISSIIETSQSKAHLDPYPYEKWPLSNYSKFLMQDFPSRRIHQSESCLWTFEDNDKKNGTMTFASSQSVSSSNSNFCPFQNIQMNPFQASSLAPEQGFHFASQEEKNLRQSSANKPSSFQYQGMSSQQIKVEEMYQKLLSGHGFSMEIWIRLTRASKRATPMSIWSFGNGFDTCTDHGMEFMLYPTGRGTLWVPIFTFYYPRKTQAGRQWRCQMVRFKPKTEKNYCTVPAAELPTSSTILQLGLSIRKHKHAFDVDFTVAYTNPITQFFSHCVGHDAQRIPLDIDQVEDNAPLYAGANYRLFIGNRPSYGTFHRKINNASNVIPSKSDQRSIGNKIRTPLKPSHSGLTQDLQDDVKVPHLATFDLFLIAYYGQESLAAHDFLRNYNTYLPYAAPPGGYVSEIAVESHLNLVPLVHQNGLLVHRRPIIFIQQLPARGKLLTYPDKVEITKKDGPRLISSAKVYYVDALNRSSVWTPQAGGLSLSSSALSTATRAYDSFEYLVLGYGSSADETTTYHFVHPQVRKIMSHRTTGKKSKPPDVLTETQLLWLKSNTVDDLGRGCTVNIFIKVINDPPQVWSSRTFVVPQEATEQRLVFLVTDVDDDQNPDKMLIFFHSMPESGDLFGQRARDNRRVRLTARDIMNHERFYVSSMTYQYTQPLPRPEDLIEFQAQDRAGAISSSRAILTLVVNPHVQTRVILREDTLKVISLSRAGSWISSPPRFGTLYQFKSNKDGDDSEEEDDVADHDWSVLGRVIHINNSNRNRVYVTDPKSRVVYVPNPNYYNVDSTRGRRARRFVTSYYPALVEFSENNQCDPGEGSEESFEVYWNDDDDDDDRSMMMMITTVYLRVVQVVDRFVLRPANDDDDDDVGSTDLSLCSTDEDQVATSTSWYHGQPQMFETHSHSWLDSFCHIMTTFGRHHDENRGWHVPRDTVVIPVNDDDKTTKELRPSRRALFRLETIASPDIETQRCTPRRPVILELLLDLSSSSHDVTFTMSGSSSKNHTPHPHARPGVEIQWITPRVMKFVCVFPMACHEALAALTFSLLDENHNHRDHPVVASLDATIRTFEAEGGRHATESRDPMEIKYRRRKSSSNEPPSTEEDGEVFWDVWTQRLYLVFQSSSNASSTLGSRSSSSSSSENIRASSSSLSTPESLWQRLVLWITGIFVLLFFLILKLCCGLKSCFYDKPSSQYRLYLEEVERWNASHAVTELERQVLTRLFLDRVVAHEFALCHDLLLRPPDCGNKRALLSTLVGVLLDQGQAPAFLQTCVLRDFFDNPSSLSLSSDRGVSYSRMTVVVAFEVYWTLVGQEWAQEHFHHALDNDHDLCLCLAQLPRTITWVESFLCEESIMSDHQRVYLDLVNQAYFCPLASECDEKRLLLVHRWTRALSQFLNLPTRARLENNRSCPRTDEDHRRRRRTVMPNENHHINDLLVAFDSILERQTSPPSDVPDDVRSLRLIIQCLARRQADVPPVTR